MLSVPSKPPRLARSRDDARHRMQGLLTFVSLDGWETGPAVIGILLALCSMIIVREVAPYESPSSNALANIAQLQLLATCASIS